MKKKYDKKFKFLVDKYGERYNVVNELKNEDLEKYGRAQVLKNEYKVRDEYTEEPTIVCMINEEVQLSEDEAEVLKLGPKFCVMNRLCEETFEREIEECILKYRWEKMGSDEKTIPQIFRQDNPITFPLFLINNVP